MALAVSSSAGLSQLRRSSPLFCWCKSRFYSQLSASTPTGVLPASSRTRWLHSPGRQFSSTAAPTPPVPELLAMMNSQATTSGGTILSDLGPVIFTAEVLGSVKDGFGLSWVATILLTTTVVRLGTGLPIAISQQRALKRLEDLKPQVQELAAELKKETGFAVKKFGWDEKTAKIQFRKSFKKHWRKLVEEHNCHPMKSLCLGLTQIPVWICFSSAIRNIVFGLPLPRTEGQALRWYEMFQEGTPWIDHLTTSDPVVLPSIFLVVNLLNIYLHSRNRPQNVPQSKLQVALPWIFGGGIVGISLFATVVPSAVTLYWATSSSVALMQNLVLMHPSIRKKLKMPINLPTRSSDRAEAPAKS